MRGCGERAPTSCPRPPAAPHPVPEAGSEQGREPSPMQWHFGDLPGDGDTLGPPRGRPRAACFQLVALSSRWRKRPRMGTPGPSTQPGPRARGRRLSAGRGAALGGSRSGRGRRTRGGQDQAASTCRVPGIPPDPPVWCPSLCPEPGRDVRSLLSVLPLPERRSYCADPVWAHFPPLRQGQVPGPR